MDLAAQPKIMTNSGSIYFYRQQVGDQIETRKMLMAP